jgi:hypothetical protein
MKHTQTADTNYIIRNVGKKKKVVLFQRTNIFHEGNVEFSGIFFYLWK